MIVRGGWSLKQLLVVLAIMVMLAALVFPVFQIVRYRVLEAKCRANLWAIYTEYKLLKIRNGGRWDSNTAKELNQWLISQGPEILRCPLSGDNYNIVALRFHPMYDISNPYLLSDFGKWGVYYREGLVATCECHTRPPRPRCGRPYVGPACVLSVLDIGDGKIGYYFDIYTKDHRTGEIISPKEGYQCPDPRQLPDVSEGY